MWNDKDEKNGGHDDLSDMINAYSQDNELRRKINELKKQKETNTINDTEDSLESQIEIPRQESNKLQDITVDDDVTKTRIGFQGDSAYDKTLVIMDSKPKADFAGDSETEDEFDDSDKTMITDFDALQGIEEEREEQDPKHKTKKKNGGNKPKAEENEKLNKILTYSIITIAAIAILIGGGIGVKLAIDHFSSPKTADTEKPEDEDKPVVKDTQPDEDKIDTDKPSTDITDNSAKIAKLQGEIDILDDQLAEKIAALTTANKELKAAEKSRNNYVNQFNNLKAEADAAQTAMNAAKKAMILAESAYKKADSSSEDYEDLKEAYEDAIAVYDEKTSIYNEKDSRYKSEKKRYLTVIKPLDKAVTNAQNKVDTLTNEKTVIERQIADKTTELNALN